MNLSGSPLDYLVVFAGGVALSFTPCVYPLLPVSLGFIGAEASGSRSKGFFLSLLYVLGIALTYSLLGLIASLSGQIFGRISSLPLTYILVGILIFIFGLAMLDIIHLRLPVSLRLPALKRGNYFSTLALGMASGLVISPCVSPVLASILTYLATRKNIIYGMTLLFTFAFGMGTVLILAGTFGGVLANLPKAGKWMPVVKKLFAFILMTAGLYFILKGMGRIS
jgi:thiol:disulfide interchange protein DsbD